MIRGTEVTKCDARELKASMLMECKVLGEVVEDEILTGNLLSSQRHHTLAVINGRNRIIKEHPLWKSGTHSLIPPYPVIDTIVQKRFQILEQRE